MVEAVGNVLSQTDYTSGGTASLSSETYNEAGQLLTSVNGVGDTTSYGYDADGHVILQVAGYGSTDSANTSFEFDQAGDQTEVIGPDGDTTWFAYNADGLKTAMTETLGASQSSESYSYNKADQLISTIDENGGTEDFVNDAAGRVISETWYNSGGTDVEDFSYSFDEAGNMLSAENNQGTDTFSYSFTYDGAGDVLTADEPFGVSLSFGYDLADHRTSVSDSLGGSETLAEDADGDLTSLNYSDSSDTAAFDFSYNLADQQTQETMYTGGTLIATVSESYDADGDVLNLVDTNSAGSTLDSYS
ncbi:MAG: hypothetical protein ACRELF_29930, partial [Gemmataceae bacterium]